MIRYFDVKSSLFGTNKLVKDIDLSDLNGDDVKSLCCLISKLKDRANRSVIFFFPGLRRAENLQNELRALFYLYMEVCNSLNSPNRGVVFVLYDVDNFRGNLGGLGVNELSRLFFSMPMHIAGLHVCLGKQQLPATVVAKGVMMFSSSRIKAKTRVHCGSHIECQYLLSTFGIPRNPLQQFCQNQKLIRDHQLAWYHYCVQKETASKQLPVANSLTPKDNDVLYLGRKVQSAGNDRLLALAAQHADWYFDGNSKERRTLIDLMIDEVRKSGGRFLKPDSTGNTMEALPVEEVRVKISQLFRNLKKRSRLSSQKAPSASPAASPETIRLVEQIRDDDVLFGRMYEHPGNKRLRELVESVSMEYDRSTRGRKKEIADSIVAAVKQAGGRFLKPAEGGKWVEVSDNAAELKVSCRFRNVRRKTNDSE